MAKQDPPHCGTCRCETPQDRHRRAERERAERERAEREREFIKNHAILTDEDLAWARDHLAGKR